MTNDFETLSAESEITSFAQFSPLEHQEAQAYFAEMETKFNCGKECLTCGGTGTVIQACGGAWICPDCAKQWPF